MARRKRLDANTEEIILFPGDPPEIINLDSFGVMLDVIQGKGILYNLNLKKNYDLPLKGRIDRINSSLFTLFNPPENKKFLCVLLTTIKII